MDLNEVGAHPTITPEGMPQIRFGLYLPNITPDEGFQLEVLVIHELDQFDRRIPPQEFPLAFDAGHPSGLWQVTVPFTASTTEHGRHFGEDGTYLYRYRLLRHNQPAVFWFPDPFARATGLGSLAAFTVGNGDIFSDQFEWSDDDFRVPEVDDLVVYELNVAEFNHDFDGVVKQLDYLSGLGINCLELMPITNVPEKVEWGYTPLGYFAPDDRFGGPVGMKHLVDACHTREIAVILDAVYGHCHPNFAYNRVYRLTGVENPMLGDFQAQFEGLLGPDYNLLFAREFFHRVNEYWLDAYHVDGFRYDFVPGFYDGPLGNGYAELLHHTYRFSRSIPRFQAENGRSRIIHCAEHLSAPREIIAKTYSNTCWQNEFHDMARGMANQDTTPGEIGQRLDPELGGYPTTYHNPATGETLPVAPFQYVETHDHARFINEFALSIDTSLVGEPFGDRSLFYKTQPYVIALYTAKGIPMLWQGQELGENWGLSGGTDIRRILFERPVHWEYFYDPIGRALVRLYRRLGEIRRQQPALRSRSYLFYENQPGHRDTGLVVYRRQTSEQAQQAGEILIIALNFRDVEQAVEVTFPIAGQWRDLVDADQPDPLSFQVNQPGDRHHVKVPSNYGVILSS